MESIFVDWSAEDIYEKWEFTGANLVRQREEEKLRNCPHGNADNGYCDECEVYPDERADENYPMMNFAYPLYMGNISDEKILEVCDETNLTVVYNIEEDSYYLALTGGGMDLSQDIALAYLIATGWIPVSLLTDINIQPMLSVSRENWLKIANKVIEGISHRISHMESIKKEWETAKQEVEKEAKT